ncbi:uncharacterized protein AKAME5_000098700 [Lates japonicus]|uniref:Uncharacterized protein n=1 Tax=Lates japonicus TaxID=270547 RepID=A0AAD3QWZ3_LATJO|nr:uncharacterized protein AKAME5_000098700 [Lates japonicus]
MIFINLIITTLATTAMGKGSFECSFSEPTAPVSKPDVSQTCLSPEQMAVSCSSDGDGVEFILTLDGHSEDEIIYTDVRVIRDMKKT